MNRFILTLVFLLFSARSHAAILVLSQDGTSSDKVDLVAAATTADARGKTIVVTSPQKISADLTWPADRTLEVKQGGLLTIAAGKTLTTYGPVSASGAVFAGAGNVVINGTITAPLTQIFANSGTATFGSSSSKEVYPEWFGINGTKDYLPIQKAASALTSGGVLVMTGTYSLTPFSTTQTERVHLLDNTWVKGLGKSKTLLQASGVSSWFFDASGKSNIKISDLSVTNGNVLFMTGGNNVTIDNINANGYVASDTAHTLASEAVRLYGVTGLRVSNSNFIDYNVGIELFDKAGIKTTDVVISKCRFEQLKGHHGTYWDNPVGVYLVSTDNVKVSDCTFLNIAPGGSALTRMGYGFYAGDGVGVSVVDNTVLANNHFEVNEGALDTAYTQHVLFWANSGKWTSTGNMYIGKAPVVGAGTDVKSMGDTFVESTLLIYKADNAMVGKGTFKKSYGNAITFGRNTDLVKNAAADNNVIDSPAKSAIYFDVAGTGTAVNNTIREPNTSAAPGADAIFYSSCYTAITTGNTITSTTTGKAAYGIHFSGISKEYIRYDNNTIEGMRTGRMINGYDTLPTKGLWHAGDRVTYQKAAAGTSPGAVCVFSLDTTLSAGLSAGGTAITVASGTGTANGDPVGIMGDDGYYRWTTIASGGGTTSITLAAGLRAASARGSKVHIFRFKPM